jgi:retron-type reverse transcriptase
MVLTAIWEPDFEKMNRSFGFKPNKSCHDATVALESNSTKGLYRALKGNISAAYDRKQDALACLVKKINYRKFLNFMKSRLDYDYVDVSNMVRVRPTMGILQGGIDSPYLFNILRT